MYDFFSWLFDAESFVTRQHCGDWGGLLPWVYAVANLLIALAYFRIPLTLLDLYRKRKDVLPERATLVQFAAFITLCGITHLLDVLVFYWAPYRLFTLVYILTALVSIGTALSLPRAANAIFQLPNPVELQNTIDRLDQEVATRKGLEKVLTNRNENLRKEADVLRELLERMKGHGVLEQDYLEARETLHRLRGA